MDSGDPSILLSRHLDSQPEVEQWEDLDMGDSELPSFLRPCKRKSLSESMQPQENPNAPNNSNAHDLSLIPGPARVVQVAIRRKMNKDPRSFNEHGESIPTQQLVRMAMNEPELEDSDFSENPWVSAVEYIESLSSNDANSIRTTVSQIKSRFSSWGKVDQVVAIIKSCTPNGQGDLMLTLKDPTGTIDCSVHRKVFLESEVGRDIKVGAVVLLKQVTVCATSRLSTYLNITLRNVSKVFPKKTTAERV